MNIEAHPISNNQAPRRMVFLNMRFSNFKLPPVQDALVIGRRAPVGANGIARAFAELTPGAFRLVRVENPIIEAVLVREADLHKLPEDVFVARLVQYAEAVMDESEALHVSISIEISIENEQIELP